MGDLVPSSVLSPPSRARATVSAVAAAVCAACALAGCWPRIDDGLGYRLGLGLTSAIFGGLVVRAALGATSAGGAAWRAIGASAAFGAASAALPSVLVATREHVPFMVCLVFGGFLGIFVGLAYGVVLAALSGLAFRGIASETHDGADRAVRRAAAFAIVPLAFAFAGVMYDRVPLPEWSAERAREAHVLAAPLGMLGLGIGLAVATTALVVASRRRRARGRWLAQVAADEARWAIRPVAPDEDVEALPRLGEGRSVLEYRGDIVLYRVAATGRAVARL